MEQDLSSIGNNFLLAYESYTNFKTQYAERIKLELILAAKEVNINSNSSSKTTGDEVSGILEKIKLNPDISKIRDELHDAVRKLDDLLKVIYKLGESRFSPEIIDIVTKIDDSDTSLEDEIDLIYAGLLADAAVVFETEFINARRPIDNSYFQR